jgi:hypothetical protein
MKFFTSDARLFGLQVWPRRLTDSEYVERLRKQLRAAGWLRYVHAASGLAVIIVAAWSIDTFFNLINNPAAPFAQRNVVNIVFATAVIFGAFIGLMLGSMMHRVLMSFFGLRQERLLIDCWDALNRLLAERYPEDHEPQERSDSCPPPRLLNSN